MQDLGDLPGGSDYSEALGINDSGQVVGLSVATTGPRAFLWSSGTGIQDLGDLPGGSDQSAANGINDSGQVVGSSYAATGDRAFLWSSGSGMFDLNDYLDASGSGWTLYSARAVNDAGQIVGSGYIGGQPHAFLLTPVPEPGTFALLGIVGVCLGGYVWRKRKR
jgi:probable HAF family extracellular repeat protein